MSFLLVLSTLIKSLPQLIALIVMVENAVKESGHGSAKFEAVLEMIRLALLAGMNLSDAQVAQALDFIAKIIPLIVKLFNTAGWPPAVTAQTLK